MKRSVIIHSKTAVYSRALHGVQCSICSTQCRGRDVACQCDSSVRIKTDTTVLFLFKKLSSSSFTVAKNKIEKKKKRKSLNPSIITDSWVDGVVWTQQDFVSLEHRVFLPVILPQVLLLCIQPLVVLHQFYSKQLLVPNISEKRWKILATVSCCWKKVSEHFWTINFNCTWITALILKMLFRSWDWWVTSKMEFL